jgi:DNA repair protein RadA/Sms
MDAQRDVAVPDRSDRLNPGVHYHHLHGERKTVYVCSDCGGVSPKWLGKCPSCQAWNTLIESVPESTAPTKNRFASLVKIAQAMTLGDIDAVDMARTPTGDEELDSVLSGGMVEDGVVLIGGNPGIGKSTLLLQALDSLQRSGQNTLYVTGEESGAQVALRSRRLGSKKIMGRSVKSCRWVKEVLACHLIENSLFWK